MNILTYIFMCLAIIPVALYPGAVQDLYQATYDMRDLFIATTTTLQADAATLKDELLADAENLKEQLSNDAIHLKQELLDDVFLLTGSLELSSADPATLNTKEKIDAAQLSVIELLKTILYKLQQMAPV